MSVVPLFLCSAPIVIALTAWRMGRVYRRQTVSYSSKNGDEVLRHHHSRRHLAFSGWPGTQETRQLFG
jgi:hypothetical protein